MAFFRKLGERILGRVARAMDMRLYNSETMWYRDDAFRDLWLQRQPGAKGVKDRHYVLYHLAKLARDVEGASVECGVWHGDGSWLILKALDDSGRQHHVIDSFEGLSEPGERDNTNTRQLFKWKKGDLSVNLETVQKNLSEFANCVYHEGWIPEVLSKVSVGKVAFLHIDVDLHEPTLGALEFFYDKMSPRGVIVCDDYHSNSCPGAKLAFDEFFADKPEEIIKTVTDQAFVIKS